MNIRIIGEYEVTYQPEGEPALVVHHVVRGYDTAILGAAATAELRSLLAIQQKRIREVGSYRGIFGATGDFVLYTAAGQRACYFNAEQTEALVQMMNIGALER